MLFTQLFIVIHLGFLVGAQVPFYLNLCSLDFLCIFQFWYTYHIYFVLQIRDGFADGKDLVVTVMSAMGEEQICALKDIGPK